MHVSRGRSYYNCVGMIFSSGHKLVRGRIPASEVSNLVSQCNVFSFALRTVFHKNNHFLTPKSCVRLYLLSLAVAITCENSEVYSYIHK